jgi:hypothetical protein
MGGHEQSGTYTDCFWDSEINGDMPGFGYTRDSTVLLDTVGETTANMQMAATYQGRDWDFDTVWKICENMNYPRLILEAEIPGDIACPDGVGIEDFAAVAAQWGLPPHLDGDIWPNGGDGIVNISDFARIGAAWLSVSPDAAFDEECDLPLGSGDGTIDVDDLVVVAGQWLEKSIYSADIAPDGGDDEVNGLDLAVIGENWLTGR